MSDDDRLLREADSFGVFAFVVYLGVGGLLVLAFAWALIPAIGTQKQAVCRALQPEARDIDAPDFEVQDLEGNPVRLADYRGKFLVVNFWATWCEPCLREWPQLHQLAERVAGEQDIAVVAISTDEDRSLVGPFLDRMALGETKVDVLWDPKSKEGPEGSVSAAFGTTKLPDTYFVDARGKIVSAFINVRKWGAPEAYHCVRGTAAGDAD